MVSLLKLKDFAEDLIVDKTIDVAATLFIAPDLSEGLKMIDNQEGNILLITYPDSETDLSDKDNFGDSSSFLILLIKKNNVAAQTWKDRLLFFADFQSKMRKIKEWIIENRSLYFDSYRNEPLSIKTTFENQTLGSFDGISIEISIIDNNL